MSQRYHYTVGFGQRPLPAPVAEHLRSPFFAHTYETKSFGDGFARRIPESCNPGSSGYRVPMDQAILEHEAMRLPPKDRALLADALLGSLDDDAAREVEASWTGEAEARLAAFRRGDLKAVDGPAALRELRERRKQ